MHITRRFLLAAVFLSAGAMLGLTAPATAEVKQDFRVGWSIHVGWMPRGQAADQGIVQKWADTYGITIEVTQCNDDVESINQYTAGAHDAVTLTYKDGLSIPSAGGVDTMAVVVDDFFSSNDAVILKDGASLADIAGRNVNLVEFSVSHYLLARAREQVGMSEKDVNVINTADPDMVGAFQTPDVAAMVTWNPMVAEIVTLPGATAVFDSSQIPGEIIDLLGQERPTRGRILLDDQPLPPEPGPDRGVVFQRYSVFPHLTVLGKVLLGPELQAHRLLGRSFGATRRILQDRARGMIAEVGLAGAEAKYPAQLSGGMQQRLALAQALMMRNRVLLFDEPFGALDPGIRAEIHLLMKRLWHEVPMTVVMVTHDLREAFTLAPASWPLNGCATGQRNNCATVRRSPRTLPSGRRAWRVR